MSEQVEVIIVGGGPVGVGLAVDLGRRGVSCAVIEKRTELSSIPKGQGLSQRTLEHFANWGIADELRAARVMPRGLPIGQVTIYGDLTSDHWHAKPSREVVQEYYAEANERLPQYRTEEVLRSRMGSLPNVHDYFGCRAVTVSQDEDGAEVTIDRDGEQQVLRASFLVGCDGGHSLVREQSDIARAGTDWDELVTLVVFRSKALHYTLAERYPERSTYRVMHPELDGYWRFFGRVDADEEFFFHAPVPGGETPESFDAQAALDRAAGFPVEATIDHVGFWDLRVQVATTYRTGRIFIAGDAAHTHPPYGGFGLNNGLEDAVNLSWKLTAVLRDWGGDTLLDSYSLERQPVFRDVGEEIIGGGISDDRHFLRTYDPDRDGEAFRAAFSEMAEGFGKRLRRFEPHYAASPIVISDGLGRTSAIGDHSFEARPGHHLAPQPWSSGTDTFRALGPDFTLLALDAADEDVVRFEHGARDAGVPLLVQRDDRRDGRERYAARLVLVRPDQFVAWAGDVAPSDTARLLLTSAGR